MNICTTREFIEQYPDNPLSITAQYQIGEQFFQQGDYLNAILRINGFSTIIHRMSMLIMPCIGLRNLYIEQEEI